MLAQTVGDDLFPPAPRFLGKGEKAGRARARLPAIAPPRGDAPPGKEGWRGRDRVFRSQVRSRILREHVPEVEAAHRIDGFRQMASVLDLRRHEVTIREFTMLVTSLASLNRRALVPLAWLSPRSRRSAVAASGIQNELIVLNTGKWVSPSRPLAILIQLEDGKCRASCSWS